MNKLFIVLILWFLCAPLVIWSQPSAQARFFCLSLRFQKATSRQFGQNYTMELTTIPADPGNGELTPLFDPTLPTHGSVFRFQDPILAETVTGSINFDVPPFLDANGNGFEDFFEVSQGVASTVTQGIYHTDVDDGTVTATWSRAAGSRTGACKLRLEGSMFGQLPEFTHTFELIEYTGRLDYTSGATNVNGAVVLKQTQNSSNTLSGPVAFSKVATNRLNQLVLAPGAWTNAADQSLSYTNSLIRRDEMLKTNYYGFIVLLDGDPTTPESDYPGWFLSIDDANDANGNGVPDFSDNPAGVIRRPRLALARSNPNLSLSISGEVGRVHELEEISAVNQTNWIKVLSITLTNDPQNVQLPVTNSDRKFWRVKVP